MVPMVLFWCESTNLSRRLSVDKKVQAYKMGMYMYKAVKVCTEVVEECLVSR